MIPRGSAARQSPASHTRLFTGGAAATLCGLMFVAVTFGANLVERGSLSTARAFIDPTFTHFVQVLVTACLFVVPTMRGPLFGALMLAGAVLRSMAMFGVYRQLRRAHEKNHDMELSDWLTSVVLPLVGYLLLVATGVSFLFRRAPAFELLCASTLLTLVVGIFSAWELLLWMAIAVTERREPEAAREPGEARSDGG